jgi:hypothetical protein
MPVRGPVIMDAPISFADSVDLAKTNSFISHAHIPYCATESGLEK